MNGWIRRLAAVTVLMATMMSLAAPAFAGCSCAPCRDAGKVAAARNEGSHSCPGCHAPAAATGTERISAASCCTSRVLVDTRALSPAPTQVDRPAPVAHLAVLPAALSGLAFGTAAIARPFVDVSPPHPPSPPHLSNLLRL